MTKLTVKPKILPTSRSKRKTATSARFGAMLLHLLAMVFLLSKMRMSPRWVGGRWKLCRPAWEADKMEQHHTQDARAFTAFVDRVKGAERDSRKGEYPKTDRSGFPWGDSPGSAQCNLYLEDFRQPSSTTMVPEGLKRVAAWPTGYRRYSFCLPEPYRTYRLPINFGVVHTTALFYAASLPFAEICIVFSFAIRTIGWSDTVGMSLGVYIIDDPLLMEQVRNVSSVMILEASQLRLLDIEVVTMLLEGRSFSWLTFQRVQDTCWMKGRAGDQKNRNEHWAGRWPCV